MFVYSSYHLNISFPSSGSHFNKLERVLETPKNGFVSTVTLWITLNKTNSKTRLFVLYSQNYAARALPILFNTPKKSLLKSSYPKKYLPNFHTQKSPRMENLKPKKILWSSPSLEIPSTPPGQLSTGLKHFWAFVFWMAKLKKKSQSFFVCFHIIPNVCQEHHWWHVAPQDRALLSSYTIFL